MLPVIEMGVAMGSMYGWHCEECGAKEEFYCGGGFLSFNNPEVVEMSSSGDYGPAMEVLLGSGIPDGWTVFNENVFYLCPECDSIIPGAALTIEDGSGSWLVYYNKPEVCPSCGEELSFWDDKTPIDEGVLWARCQRYVETGCPKCGGKKVTADLARWD